MNRKLRRFEKVVYTHPRTKEKIEREIPKEFMKPWASFTIDTKNYLNNIVVSFKQNLRVINKATNFYEKWVETNGLKTKKLVQQSNGNNWAIRKSLHTPMPYSKKIYSFDILKISDNVGKREYIIDENLKTKVEEIFQAHNQKVTAAQKYLKQNPILDINNIKVISTAFKIKSEKFRRRQPISELSNRGQGGIKTIDDAKKFIDKITDYKIREDLLQHLLICDNDIDKAFSAEGLEDFNSRRKIPIYKLPIAESGTGRFVVGDTIGTRHKWVEADKGTNLFFAIYQDENGKRSYETIPLNIVIERQKQALYSVPETDENGKRLLFHLSPNDLVYLLNDDERENKLHFELNDLNNKQIDRIYKAVSFTGSQCFFVKHQVATTIVNKIEYSSLNKMEKSVDEIMIKEYCIKLSVDRLGNIKPIKTKF